MAAAAVLVCVALVELRRRRLFCCLRLRRWSDWPGRRSGRTAPRRPEGPPCSSQSWTAEPARPDRDPPAAADFPGLTVSPGPSARGSVCEQSSAPLGARLEPAVCGAPDEREWTMMGVGRVGHTPKACPSACPAAEAGVSRASRTPVGSA